MFDTIGTVGPSCGTVVPSLGQAALECWLGGSNNWISGSKVWDGPSVGTPILSLGTTGGKVVERWFKFCGTAFPDC